MKKYLFTEEQIKKVVDHVINHVMNEQTDNNTNTMMVQCFLNQIMKANLVVDGKTGPNSQTEKALKIFQSKKKVWPVDGVWGYQTQSTLTPMEQEIWTSCRKKYQ